MLKGKATIQLINSENKVVHEVVEENIITVAAEKIATLSDRDFIKGLRSNSSNIFYYHAQNVTPLATELFGGILLFEGALPEDPNMVFPPTNAKPVAHAGAPYSGTNPNRGTYNAAESGPLSSGLETIGYRHVWDFVTDRGNATIGCVCLTSRLGGNVGWQSRPGLVFDADSQIDTYLMGGLNPAHKLFSTTAASRGPALVSQMFTGGSDSYMFYLDDDQGFAYHITNSGMIAKSTFNSQATLRLDNVPAYLDVSALTDVFNTESIYLGRRTFVTFNPSDDAFTIVRPKSATALERKVVSSSGVIQLTEEVPLAEALYNWSNPAVPPFYYKGYYYATILQNNNYHLGKFDSVGALIKTFDLSTFGNLQAVVTYSAALDRIIIKGRPSTNVVDIIFNGETLEHFKTADSSSTLTYPVDEPKKSDPGFYGSINEYAGPAGSNSSLYYKFRTNYLASINNLATPVRKTASDMMKITYDILYE